MNYSKHTDNNSKGTCNCCGKPLTDRISVDFGIGPVCRVKRKTQEAQERSGNMFANRAEYDWEFCMRGKILSITDEGGLKSVTNDLENILHDIQDTIPINDLLKARIMYRDSMGIWDGVKVKYNDGLAIESVTFFPLTEKDFGRACEKLLSYSF